MTPNTYVRRCELPIGTDAAFAWHARRGALQRLLPPWQNVRVVDSTGGIRDGDRVVLRLGAGPFGMRYVAEHRNYVEGVSFEDVQARGPFASWRHTHRFEPDGPTRSALVDHIEYALPAGRLGNGIANSFAVRELDRMFDFRHARTRGDLAVHQRYDEHGMKSVLISGATGLVGSELSSFLTTGGHEVAGLTRHRKHPTDIEWSPAEGKLDPAGLARFDAIVHLAGESIIGRWTEKKKRKILDSRVKGTRLLAESLARLPEKTASGDQGRPEVLVCASATGFYGDRGDEVLTENSADGEGFLPEVCKAWEQACQPARDAGIRVVNVRIGLVLTPKGGLLGTLLPLFKTGLGGRVGDGKQWMSWIAIDDLVDVFHAAIMDQSFVGPVNATALHPVTNAEFTKTLGRVMQRPTFLPAPAFAVKVALGEAADELALSSARVVPAKLQQHEHSFRFTTLEPALRFLLGRTSNK